MRKGWTKERGARGPESELTGYVGVDRRDLTPPKNLTVARTLKARKGPSRGPIEPPDRPQAGGLFGPILHSDRLVLLPGEERTMDPLDTHSTPRQRRDRTAAWMLGSVATLLVVMAIPKRVSPAKHAELEIASEVEAAAGMLREAVENYRRDHGRLPGYTPGSDRPIGIGMLFRQLTMATDARGAVAPEVNPDFPYGPYLPKALPINPINGLGSLRLLTPGEEMPDAANGSSGWLYDPETGEVRVNAAGELELLGTTFFEL